MTKKIIRSTLVLFALLFASVWGIRKIQSADFNRQFQSLNLTIIKDIPSINAIGDRHTPIFHSNIVFFSQSDHAIEKHVSASIEQAKAKQIGPFAQEWIVVYPRTATTNLANVVAYDLIEQRYHSNLLSVSPSEENITQTFYASSKTGKTITLNDLIVDKDSFRRTLNKLLQPTKENQSENLKTFNRRFLARFDTDDWSTIDFRIIDHSIDINGYFSLNYFVDSLNPDYFSKEMLDKYRKENEDLQALLQSPETTTITYD